MGKELCTLPFKGLQEICSYLEKEIKLQSLINSNQCTGLDKKQKRMTKKDKEYTVVLK